MTQAQINALRTCILEMHQETCEEGGQTFQHSPACKTALDILDHQIPDENRAPTERPVYPSGLYE